MNITIIMSQHETVDKLGLDNITKTAFDNGNSKRKK
jgi:hypothetical protein